MEDEYSEKVIVGFIKEVESKLSSINYLKRIYAPTSLAFYEQLDNISEMYESVIKEAKGFL